MDDAEDVPIFYHIHTIDSDGAYTAEEILERLHEAFDTIGVVYTEHGTLTDLSFEQYVLEDAGDYAVARKGEKEALLLRSVEIETREGGHLVLVEPEGVPPDHEPLATYTSLLEDERAEGLVVAHPLPCYQHSLPHRDVKALSGRDGSIAIEIGTGYPAILRYLTELSASLYDLPHIAALDIHDTVPTTREGALTGYNLLPETLYDDVIDGTGTWEDIVPELTVTKGSIPFSDFWNTHGPSFCLSDIRL